MQTKFRLTYQEPTKVIEDADVVVSRPNSDLWRDVDDGELDYLYLDEVMDFLPTNTSHDDLIKYINKVAHQGNLIITGLYLNSIAGAIIARTLDVAESVKLLYSIDDVSKDNMFTTVILRQNLLDFNSTIKLLESRGFKVISKRIDGFKFYIKSERI